MNWAQPWWLAALLGLAALAAVVVGANVLHARRLKTLFPGELLDRVLPRGVVWRRRVRLVMAFAALALMVIALAEPRFDKELRTIKATGVDMVLLVDVSRSMDARDVQPSRLERVRREIVDLLDMVQGDRIGLVAYAGGAYPLLPLTEDTTAIAKESEDLNTGLFTGQGSDLAAAIQVGVKLLEGNDVSTAGKALLLLSDGEAHDIEAARAAALAASEQGVVVYAIGVGKEAATIPDRGGPLTYQGEVVKTEPHPELLKELARITGGAYVESSASASDMQRLMLEMRTKLTAVERDSQTREVWKSGFAWPLGLGTLLWLGAAWLGDGRKALMPLLALLVALPAMGASVAEGDALYRQGKYAEASEMFTELALEQPDNPDVLGRLGASRYRQGDFEGAARAFERQAGVSGEEDALFNAATSHMKAGRLEKALERYDDLLAKDPSHAAATKNRQLAAEELERRRAVKPPPPEQQDGSDNEEEGGSSSDGQNDDNEGGNPGDDPKEGSSEGEQEGDSQDQPPQDGDGESDAAEPQDGDSQGSSQQSQGAEGSPEQGQQEGDQQDSEGVRPEDLDEGQGGEPTEGGSEGPEGEGQDPGAMTASQAEKLLDGVEESDPPIAIRSPNAGKPW